MNKQMENFSFIPPINLIEEGKWLPAVTSFEATDSVFNITDENNGFSISTPGYWSSKGGALTIYKLQKLFELRSQNDFEMHVEQARKRGNQIKIGDKEYKLSDPDTQKNEIIEEFQL